MSEKAKSLSRRERQIMDCLFARGEATASEIQAHLPDAPGNSAVRALLRIMEDKGLLRHREVEGRYVYRPVESRLAASRAALKRVLGIFFEGSLANAVQSLVDARAAGLTSQELQRLEEVIQKARRK